MLRRFRLSLACLMTCAFAIGSQVALMPVLAVADETGGLDAILKRAILAPETSPAELKVFTETRTLPMPEPKTVEEWEKYASTMREQVLTRVIYRGAAAAWRDADLKVEWLDVIPGGPGYRIRKLRYEALPGLWIPALLYLPDQLTGKVPVFMNVNGHDPNGKAADYKQMRCINQAKRGMIALNVEWLGMGQLGALGHAYMNQLDLCGTSGLAPFYLSMQRGLDILLSLENADPQRVGVAGLSGGGWQTIIISALDTRVTLSNPVAGYSSFKTRISNGSDMGDSEQTPVDLGAVTDYEHLTAMRAPRFTLLTYNASDNCCFKSGHALPPLLAAASPIFKLYAKEQNLRSHVNHDPGTHNFLKDNREALYRIMGDAFFPGDASYQPAEIPSESEVKSAAELNVPLPDQNPTFQVLATACSQGLPRNATIPAKSVTPEELKKFQGSIRERLHGVVKARAYTAVAEQVAAEKHDDLQVAYRRMKLGVAGKTSPDKPEWTVPLVEIVRGTPKATALVIADGGRASVNAQIASLLEKEYRVLALDPFYFGECKPAARDYLWALLISAVGERPIGVQASQIGAVARWAAAEFKGPVELVAFGPRTSSMALIAAGLEEAAIGSIKLQGSMGSFKEVIEQNQAVNQAPELFCFGLLEAVDIPQLVALVAPHPIEFLDASPRVRKEIVPGMLPGAVKVTPKPLCLQADENASEGLPCCAPSVESQTIECPRNVGDA